MSANLQRAKETGEVITQEAPVVDVDGSELWFHSTIVPVRDDDGKIEYIIVVSIETTERKRAEQQSAAEKERLAVTLRSIGDGVITTDTEGRIVLVNRVAEKLTGWKQREARGRPLPEVFNIVHEVTREPCENPVQKALASGQIVELANHTVLISRDGTERVIADSGAPIKNAASETVGVVLVFRDMTEKQKMHDIMQRTAKLESLSVLAGGIAHDFNNLLGAIFGQIDLARMGSANPEVCKSLDHALETMGRARGLTQQLLTFSRGGEPVKEVGELFPFVKETAFFALSGSNVSCRFDVSPDLWPCDFDQNQIGQVIDNLIINAQQAMPSGGTIEVEARNIPCDEDRQGALGRGRYVRVSVKDAGIGMPTDMIERVFDPFYTTKSKGHGLGLATCHSIVARHDGHIEVESQQGVGSTFHVYLPATSDAVPSASATTASTYRGRGTMVVMDDEPVIRDTIRRMLESVGFSVVCQSNARETVDFFSTAQQEGREIAGMILDLTIPGDMGGKDAIREIRKLDKRITVFVASGYSEDPIMATPEAFGFTASISKPFLRDDLIKLLSEHMP